MARTQINLSLNEKVAPVTFAQTMRATLGEKLITHCRHRRTNDSMPTARQATNRVAGNRTQNTTDRQPTRRKHDKDNPRHMRGKSKPPSADPVPPGRPGGAMDPVGTRAECRSSREHPGQVAALHHEKVVVQVGKACGTLVPARGTGCVRGLRIRRGTAWRWG
jgi:hypothetical protein